MSTSFPSRLASARKMKGFSLQKLSDILGEPFNKQLLNRFESGIQTPNSDQLIQLSRSLNRTVDYFMKASSTKIEKVNFRKTLSVGKKVTERIIEVSNDYLERYLELEDLLGLESGLKFKARTRRMVNNNKKGILKEAEKLRNDDWEVGKDALGSIIPILESQGIKVFILENLDGDLIDEKFSGFSTLVNNNIGFIVLNGNPNISLVRRRFTLLHEFAHLYLDLEGIEHKDAEKLCDAFAGAILIPNEKLIETFGENRTQIHISELKLFKAEYGSSLSSIMYGLYSSEVISKSYFTDWMIDYNRYYRKDESKGYSGAEKSNRFMQLLLRALTTDIISESKAAALNNQKTGDFLKTLDSLV